MIMSNHYIFLKQALELAQARRGFCAPNPAVGAVVVKDGTVIASGAHQASGQPHAEVIALESLPDACDATLYVTLEPCCHWGKTPPCTDLIIAKNIKQVFFGFKDPNPDVNGGGESQLSTAGILCQQLELPEINNFYRSYRYWLEHHRPFVTAKIALSLDGKIASKNGRPVAITGSELKQYTHICRKHSDAILTTVTTILFDDPQLNVRLGNEVIKKPLYILDSDLRLPKNATIFKTAKSITVFHKNTLTQKTNAAWSQLKYYGVSFDEQGLNLFEVLTLIGDDGVHDCWVEAGARCFEAFLNQQLINRGLLYVAPKILGSEAMNSFKAAFDFSEHGSVSWRFMGGDAICDVQF